MDSTSTNEDSKPVWKQKLLKKPQALKKFQINEFNFIDPDQIVHKLKFTC